jgi:nucleoid-associated protein YgaU
LEEVDMVSRYDTRNLFTNIEEKYENKFEKRNTRSILQYVTANFRHPTADDIVNLNTVNVVWKEGDRYWKLATKFYNDPTMWWVIAWFNRLPTESHVNLGDIVVVPLPLPKILDYLGL